MWLAVFGDASGVIGDAGALAAAAIAAERARAASLYRRNRMRVLLAHLQHAARIVALSLGERRPIAPGARALRVAARARAERRRFAAGTGCAHAAETLCFARADAAAAPLAVRLTGARRDASLMKSREDRTGALPWPSTPLLAALLGSTPAAAGKRVVELGAGTALLACTVAARGDAAAVVATDGEARMLGLARFNLRGAAASASPGATQSSVMRLRWGDAADAARVCARVSGARFDLAAASESFYHRAGVDDADGNGILRQSGLLFSTAGLLLEPCTCSAGGAAAASASGDVACKGGVLLLSYSPRYRSMAAPIAAAARGARLELRSLGVAAQQRASQSLYDTRLLAVSACGAALDAALKRLGLAEGAEGHDADYYDE